MKSTKEKENKVFDKLKSTFGYKNQMMAPRFTKVTVSTGTGKLSRTDKKKNEFVAGRLATITGQKPGARSAKKSIATFKLREGEVIGYQVTLRNDRMYDFLDRLFNVAIPRVRDFRGFSKKSIDSMGNITLGIREHSTFPEAAEEELKDIFGLAITIGTTTTNKEEASAFFEVIGVPFKKD